MARLKEELVRRLEQIPGVTHQPWPERDDGFSTIHFGGEEIGHFHNFNEIDLRLGRALISAEGLIHPSDSTTHPNRSPNSQFIEVRFQNTNDLSKVIHLVTRLVEEAGD